MSLSDLASLGSFVSGIAVLVSLIFLYFQLRQIGEQMKQAEKHQRGALNQGYVDRVAENLRWLAGSPQAALMTRVIAGETKFTSEELFCLSVMFRSSVVSAQDAFLQHRAGLIDDMTVETSLLGLTRAFLRHPAFRALWTGGQRETIAPAFRAEVDAIIARAEPAESADTAADFRANLAKANAKP